MNQGVKDSLNEPPKLISMCSSTTSKAKGLLDGLGHSFFHLAQIITCDLTVSITASQVPNALVKFLVESSKFISLSPCL